MLLSTTFPLVLASLISLATATASPNAAPAPNPNPQTTDSTPLPTGLPADKASSLASHLASYESSLLQNSAYTSYLSAIAAAVPTSQLASIAADPLDFLASAGAAEGTSVPEWWANVGEEAKGYVSSVVQVEEAILAEATGGAAISAGGKKESGGVGSVGRGRAWVGMGIGVGAVIVGRMI